MENQQVVRMATFFGNRLVFAWNGEPIVDAGWKPLLRFMEAGPYAVFRLAWLKRAWSVALRVQ